MYFPWSFIRARRFGESRSIPAELRILHPLPSARSLGDAISFGVASRRN
jgi:hypothetical protein